MKYGKIIEGNLEIKKGDKNDYSKVEKITGACSGGTKHFVENVLKVKKKKYTIAECIELTRGQYNSEKFEKFFN